MTLQTSSCERLKSLHLKPVDEWTTGDCKLLIDARILNLSKAAKTLKLEKFPLDYERRIEKAINTLEQQFKDIDKKHKIDHIRQKIKELETRRIVV